MKTQRVATKFWKTKQLKKSNLAQNLNLENELNGLTIC
jgi:hypothetical protein